MALPVPGLRQGPVVFILIQPSADTSKRNLSLTETRHIRISRLNNKGLTLATSIILLVFASTAVLSVTTFIIERLSQTEMKHAGTKALYLAHAGIHQAIYDYRVGGANGFFTPGTTTIPEGSFILGGTASSGFDSDFLMVDASSGSWPGASLPIAIRSSTIGGGTTNASTGNFTVNKPASVVNDDYLVCIIGKKNGTMNYITPPSGWVTGDERYDTAQNDVYGGIFYKKITNASGEPASYTFDSIGVNEPFAYWIGSLSGIDLTNPEDVRFSTETGQWIYRQNITSPQLPSVTTVTPNTFAFAAWVVNADNSTTQPGSPWTTNLADDQYPASGTATTRMLNVKSRTIASAGTATGMASLAGVANSQETEAGTFVFRPAGLNYGPIKSAIDSSIRTLTITQMAVTWTTAGRNLTQIVIGGNIVWNGTATSGQVINITDVFNITPTGLNNNQLRFDGDMQIGSLTLTATYYLSDGSTRTVTLWPTSNNFCFTVKASGKKTGSILYRTIQAEYNANTSKVVDYREINTQMQ